MRGFQQIAADVEPSDNCVVLLFNCSYDGRTTSWSGGGVTLRFFGDTRYASGGADEAK